MQQIYCDTRIWNVKRWIHGNPEDAKMRVPDEIRDCVCYICSWVKDEKSGGEKLEKWGTAFFIGLGIGNNEHRLIYLVTARHIIERAVKAGNVYVRINTISGVEEIKLDFTAWKFHDDPAVDVAVMRFCNSVANLSYQYIPAESSLAQREVLDAHHVGIGSDIILTGLFTGRVELQRNLPIVRAGMISAMPDERLLDPETGGWFDAYLVETRSIGGLSGSPVFVVMPHTPIATVHGSWPEDDIHFIGQQTPESTGMALLGIVREYYFVKDKRGVLPYVDPEFEKINMGISVVTPISKVCDVLLGHHFCDEQKAMNNKLQTSEHKGIRRESSPKS